MYYGKSDPDNASFKKIKHTKQKQVKRRKELLKLKIHSFSKTTEKHGRYYQTCSSQSSLQSPLCACLP